MNHNKEEIFSKLKSLERRDLSFVERIKIKKFFNLFDEYFEEKEESSSSELIHLTKREKEISKFVAEDLLIMRFMALEISIKTVEFHLSSVIRR